MNVPDCPFKRTPGDVIKRQPNKGEYPKATLAVLLLLTVWSSKVLAVNSVSFLADALQTLLPAAIYSALASSARVAFAVSGSEAVEYIDPGYGQPVLVCC